MYVVEGILCSRLDPVSPHKCQLRVLEQAHVSHLRTRASCTRLNIIHRTTQLEVVVIVCGATCHVQLRLGKPHSGRATTCQGGYDLVVISPYFQLVTKSHCEGLLRTRRSPSTHRPKRSTNPTVSLPGPKGVAPKRDSIP